MAEAAHDGCGLVLFPEMSLTGSVNPASHPERLMAADDAAVGRLARAAGEAGVAVCFGIAERAADGRPYITPGPYHRTMRRLTAPRPRVDSSHPPGSAGVAS